MHGHIGELASHDILIRQAIMIDMNDRKLPVGLQSFEKIRKGGYLYVDKTDIIWQLANRNKTYNYLSRPRRFGKSVLVDTLEAYFLGKKELFEGLMIMQLETEWVKRPVIRLDMSRAGAEPKTLRSYLNNIFKQYEKNILWFLTLQIVLPTVSMQ